MTSEIELIKAKVSTMNQAELIRERDRIRAAINQTTSRREIQRYYRRESIICRELDQRADAMAAVLRAQRSQPGPAK